MDDAITTNLLFEIDERKRETGGLLPLLSTMRATQDETEERQPRLSTKYMDETYKTIICQQVTLIEKTSMATTEQQEVAASGSHANMADALDHDMTETVDERWWCIYDDDIYWGEYTIYFNWLRMLDVMSR